MPCNKPRGAVWILCENAFNGDNNTLNWVDSNTVKIVGKEIVLRFNELD